VVWKSCACIKSVILDSYCFKGTITKVFPLSAHVINAALSLRFFFNALGCLCFWVRTLCVCVCV
jgi:hypothetical protein